MISKATLIIRFLFFCLFFIVGVSAILLSILAEPELVNYYTSQDLLLQIEQQNKRIISLTAQYQAQIDLIEAEPDVLKRLAPITFRTPGAQSESPDSQAKNQLLKAEAQKLQQQMTSPPKTDPVPRWLTRIIEPKIRRGLFASGAGLILITFIFFGTTRNQ